MKSDPSLESEYLDTLVSHLSSFGIYDLIECNVHYSRGEIDVVAHYQDGSGVDLFEAKNREKKSTRSKGHRQLLRAYRHGPYDKVKYMWMYYAVGDKIEMYEPQYK